MLVLGRVGLGHFTCGSRWVGSRKLDPRPTLALLALKVAGLEQLCTSFSYLIGSYSPVIKLHFDFAHLYISHLVHLCVLVQTDGQLWGTWTRAPPPSWSLRCTPIWKFLFTYNSSGQWYGLQVNTSSCSSHRFTSFKLAKRQFIVFMYNFQ